MIAEITPQSSIEHTSREALDVLASPELDIRTKAKRYAEVQKRLQNNLRNSMPEEFHSKTTPNTGNTSIQSIHSPEGEGGKLDFDPLPPEGEPVKRHIGSKTLDVRDRSDLEFFVTDALKKLNESEKKIAHHVISIIHDKIHMYNSDIIGISGEKIKVSRHEFRDYIIFLASDAEAISSKAPKKISEMNSVVERALISNKNNKYKPITRKDIEKELSNASRSMSVDDLKEYLDRKHEMLDAIKEQLRLDRIRTIVKTTPPRDERMWITKGMDWLMGRENHPYGIDDLVKRVPKPLRQEAKKKLYTIRQLNLLTWNERGELIEGQHLWKDTNIKDIVEFWFAEPNRIRRKVEFRPLGADAFLTKVIASQTELLSPPDSPLRKIMNAQMKIIKNGVNLIGLFYSSYSIINGVFGFDLFTWLTVALTVTNASFAEFAGHLTALGSKVGIIPSWAGKGVQQTLKGAGHVVDRVTTGLNPIVKITSIVQARNFVSWLCANSHWLISSMISVIALYTRNRRGDGQTPLRIEGH